ncbi:P-loop containing nucleoside triphosphate hydrolase protein [Coccomyxa subellipsoidea C-169]|uniref:P-loop containing nucleoside triphosphate hydrolase protein n=1 Tax=Coccomyxa subellipsoidea (strain C-169) TaxID=574566 RepID=I0YJQ2_COCSC|nr:P-loop containing nucleoside triphosphate hydrolase protein [Coccomyxa subellipsoidea C-169]EIE18621.1 P-loop containing nucleoside triphosphate hydrolase protein [Coccomyxa subellipsoidea C-169]|eukprot:XP_005643165.1 P-loop containing nucleoside triphosphate hydrolase protein [Coccomyxa subellipsoidea C-169]
MNNILRASHSRIFCTQQCFPSCSRQHRSLYGRISQIRTYHFPPPISQQRSCSELAASTLHVREAVQAQPSSTSSMESEDAWFNDEPQQRSSGETSTSGRVESDLEFLELPKAQNVRVKKAEFVKSSTNMAQCPKSKLPEFAVIGRSNVGKSSLINMLTGQAALAKVSKTPGKTIYINHFLINDNWYLVDLPGYGYAQRSKASRLEWSSFTKEYFLKRETLANVLLLVDASVPVQQADLECASWLADAQVPFSLVFTKTDKRKKKCPSPRENMQTFQAALLKEFENLPLIFETDSETLKGHKELLSHVAGLL